MIPFGAQIFSQQFQIRHQISLEIIDPDAIAAGTAVVLFDAVEGGAKSWQTRNIP